MPSANPWLMQLGNPSKKRALKIHDRQGSGGPDEKRVGLFFRRGFPRFGYRGVRPGLRNEAHHPSGSLAGWGIFRYGTPILAGIAEKKIWTA